MASAGYVFVTNTRALLKAENINEWKKWDGKMFKNTGGGNNNVVKDKLKKNYMGQTGR